MQNSQALVEKYCINLNQKALDGTMKKTVEPINHLISLMETLTRQDKNNVLLVGEEGVGKKSLIDSFVFKIIDKTISSSLSKKTIIALNIFALRAGAKDDGEFEERFRDLLDEIKANKNYILFVDGFEELITSSHIVENNIKSTIAMREIQVIVTTTSKDFRQYFEKDKLVLKSFKKIIISEPSIEETIKILLATKTNIESWHNISITEDALFSAVKLSARYIGGSFLPKKAIELLDEASSKLKLQLETEPRELIKAKQNIESLTIEQTALVKENLPKNRYKLKKIHRQLEDNQNIKNNISRRYEEERAIFLRIKNLNDKLKQERLKAVSLRREEMLDEASKIEYEIIPLIEKKLIEENRLIEQIPKNQRFIKSQVDEEMIAEIISLTTGIQTGKMLTEQMDKILNIEKIMRQDVIGQDEALRTIAKAIKRNKAGIGSPYRPIGSFIFLGTTGVGKTQVAKTVAKVLFDDDSSLIRFDMSEYMDKDNVNRLVGAPPGNAGYEDGGQLTEAVKNYPYSVILFDEVEKAHPDVFNLLLQVLDDGRLTDSKGITVNFKNTIIILTSNIGSEDINTIKDRNFRVKEVHKKIKQFFKPEFINRLDSIVIFEKLGPDDILRIVDVMLREVAKRLKSKDITLSLTSRAREVIAKNGFDPDYGARPLRRAIVDNVEDEIVELILSGQLREGQHVEFNIVNRVFSAKVTDKNKPTLSLNNSSSSVDIANATNKARINSMSKNS
jgi:ATP-dependent Clp protease ATP-binding subunit ClpB